MKLILILFLVLSCTIVDGQDPICNCTPSTQFDRQERSAAKHETNYTNFKIKEDTITVKYIYKWQDKYKNVTKSIAKNPLNPASHRNPATPEDTLYTLRGYIWFVKTEDNDCDFHIEIGPKSSTATRIVIEVPKENRELQIKILAHLTEMNLKVMGCGTSSSEKAHYKKGIPVVVTGLGFYDASHKPDTNHGDKHTRKYSWELHPVREIIFL